MTEYAAYELSCCEHLIQRNYVDYHGNYEAQFKQEGKL